MYTSLEAEGNGIYIYLGQVEGVIDTRQNIEPTSRGVMPEPTRGPHSKSQVRVVAPIDCDSKAGKKKWTAPLPTVVCTLHRSHLSAMIN